MSPVTWLLILGVLCLSSMNMPLLLVSAVSATVTDSVWYASDAPDFVPNAGSLSYADVRGAPYKVDYDHRAIRINGQRVLLLSGGMHYPRSSPLMWPQLMEASRAAGLNTVQSYVFHNYHEAIKGQWDWKTEHRDLGRWLQAAADAGMFVNLRIGPYGQTEQNRTI